MMKGLKKFTAFIMAVAMVMISVPFTDSPIVAKAAEVYGDFTYTVLEDGSVEISKYTGAGGTVEIPEEIDGKKVTSIGYNAFYNCSSLTEINILSSVTSIGWNAFNGCDNLLIYCNKDSEAHSYAKK